MLDFEMNFKNGKKGWVSDAISPLLDEYPAGYSTEVQEGLLFRLNDGSARTVLFSPDRACCVIENERTKENVKLDFEDFLSEENLTNMILDSLDEIVEPNLTELQQEKLQLEKELAQVNAAIERAEKKMAHLALQKSNPSKGGRRL